MYLVKILDTKFLQRPLEAVFANELRLQYLIILLDIALGDLRYNGTNSFVLKVLVNQALFLALLLYLLKLWIISKGLHHAMDGLFDWIDLELGTYLHQVSLSKMGSYLQV